MGFAQKFLKAAQRVLEEEEGSGYACHPRTCEAWQCVWRTAIALQRPSSRAAAPVPRHALIVLHCPGLHCPLLPPARPRACARGPALRAPCAGVCARYLGQMWLCSALCSVRTGRAASAPRPHAAVCWRMDVPARHGARAALLGPQPACAACAWTRAQPLGMPVPGRVAPVLQTSCRQRMCR